jgi:plasmid stabilization system protein ParE
MKHSVTWSPDALTALADIWVQAADRQAVSDAEARIDRLLAADPLGQGALQSEGLYVIEVHPLRVQFEVDVQRRSVWVVSVRELP